MVGATLIRPPGWGKKNQKSKIAQASNILLFYFTITTRWRWPSNIAGLSATKTHGRDSKRHSFDIMDHSRRERQYHKTTSMTICKIAKILTLSQLTVTRGIMPWMYIAVDFFLPRYALTWTGKISRRWLWERKIFDPYLGTRRKFSILGWNVCTLIVKELLDCKRNPWLKAKLSTLAVMGHWWMK